MVWYAASTCSSLDVKLSVHTIMSVAMEECDVTDIVSFYFDNKVTLYMCTPAGMEVVHHGLMLMFCKAVRMRAMCTEYE